MNGKRKNAFTFLISFVLTLSMLLSLTAVNAAAAVSGDVNGDGAVTYKDAKLVLQYVKNNEFTNASKYDFSGADMDGDKMVTATDAAKIMSIAKADELPAAATLFVLGDSTGCDYAANADANYYYKRVGFGTRLSDYFIDQLTVKNLAISGRSSKSFLSEEYYQTYLNELKEGDYVIIAFGHNDEKKEDSTRYTDPTGGKDDEGSFKNSLYVNYIQPALKAGATPILCTPTVRRISGTTWSDSSLHKANGGDYAECVRELGNELGLTVIDNTSLTQNLYTKLGADETQYLHAWTSSSATSVDNTHLNNYGASWVAYMMADSIENSDNSLKNYVETGIVEPNKGVIIINPDYKEKVQAELTKSILWTTTDPWWGSVFGDIGGAGKLNPSDVDGNVLTDQLAINTASGRAYFNVEEVSSGSAFSFNLRAGEAKADNTSATSVGKIASGTDGMAAVFQAVSSDVNFSISAVANIEAIHNSNSQVAFGAIVLDSVEIDTYSATSYNYIAASPLKMAEATAAATDENPNPTMWMGYGRIEGTLKAGGTVTGDERAEKLPKAGDKIPVKITKVGNKYTVECNGVVSEMEANFTDDVYVGLFVARCADVTFTDVVFNNEVAE